MVKLGYPHMDSSSFLVLPSHFIPNLDNMSIYIIKA